MGNLHVGHASLIDKASNYNDPIFTSIFVNPLQFNDKKDFERYPITLDNDIKILESYNCSCLYLPDESILDNISKINAPSKANFLCGLDRPGHFDGVLTIVNKLFEIIKPSRAFFGLKDYQQLILISDFVNHNNLPIEIISAETVRDKNGLAMSSRNNHLSESDKLIASELYKALRIIEENKEKISKEFIDQITDKLITFGFSLDYLQLCDLNTLDQIEDMSKKPILIAIAANFKGIRLIDNIIIK